MKLVLAALALAGSLALTACGSSVSLTPVAKAATKTSGAGSEHVAYTGTVSVAGQTMQMQGSGDFQNDPKLGAMSMTMDGGGQHAQIGMVMKDWTIWMKSPLFTKALPGGKAWLSIDLQKAGKRLGVDYSQFAQQSPTDVLAALQKSGTVTKIGAATLNGEQTTHYRAVVDFTKAPNGAAVQKLTHLKSVPVDVWVGSDGLLRRLTESFETTVSGQTTSTSMTMDFSKFGEPVNVQVPSADETLDMTKLGG